VIGNSPPISAFETRFNESGLIRWPVPFRLTIVFHMVNTKAANQSYSGALNTMPASYGRGLEAAGGSRKRRGLGSHFLN